MSNPQKLLVLDVEGTLFKSKIRLPATNLGSTIWQTLAHELGPAAIVEEIETHRRWNEREYASYLDWMKATICIHKKYRLSKTMFQQVIRMAEYNEGVSETLRRVDRDVYEIVLISGGFRELCARVQRDHSIH